MIQDVLQKTKKMLGTLITNGGIIDNSSLEDLRKDVQDLLLRENNSDNKKALSVVDNELQSLLGLKPFSGHKGTQSADIIINEVHGILSALASNNVSIYDPYKSSWRETVVRRPPSVKNG